MFQTLEAAIAAHPSPDCSAAKLAFEAADYVQRLCATPAATLVPVSDHEMLLRTLMAEDARLTLLGVLCVLIELVLAERHKEPLPAQLPQPVAAALEALNSPTWHKWLSCATGLVISIEERLFAFGATFRMTSVIKPMINLAKSFASSVPQVTAIDPIVLKACILTREFESGLSLLLPNKLTVSRKYIFRDEILRYLYYGGIIHTANRRFDDALGFFEACTAFPATQTVQKIQLHSNIHRILVAFIACKGVHRASISKTLCQQPSNAGTISNPALQAMTEATLYYCYPASKYVSLLRRRKFQDAASFLRDNQRYFDAAGVLSLAELAANEARIQLVTCLPKIYLSLPLADIAKMIAVPMPQAECLVKFAIKSGVLAARIHPDNHVLFFDSETSVPTYTRSVDDKKYFEDMSLRRRIELARSLKEGILEAKVVGAKIALWNNTDKKK